ARTALDPTGGYNNVLPARYFDGHTFSTVNLYSGQVGSDALAPGGTVTVRDGLTMDLGNYGKLNVFATRVDINGTVRALGGSVSVVATSVAPSPSGGQPNWLTLDPALKPQINLGPTGEIDVAGRWVNQLINPADRRELSISGGSVTLITSNNLSLAPGSLIDVSGGGRVSADGTKVTVGNAGSISLINRVTVTGATSVPPGPRDGTLTLLGTLRGYGLQTGGSLTIASGRPVLIADRPSSNPRELTISPDLFRTGGFSSYIVSGAAGATIGAGTSIAPSVQSFVLDHSGRTVATGTRLFDVAQLETFTGDFAQPMSVTLSAPAVDANGNVLDLRFINWRPLLNENNGSVTVGTGAQIQMAPKSTLRLLSSSEIFVDGTLSAPGGLIDLRVGLSGSTPRVVGLGENARLLSQGYVKSTLRGLFTQRSVEDGGLIRITSFDLPY